MPSKLVAQILAETGGLESINRNSKLAKSLYSNGVMRCEEFLRIKGMARRILEVASDQDAGEELAEAVTSILSLDQGNQLPLRSLQAAMLVEATEHGGLLISLPVGQGKSFAAALFATDRVPEGFTQETWPQIVCERPVILLPPSVKDEMERDVLPLLRKHYRIHPNLKLIAYSSLQVERGANLLKDARPDVIIADECDALKNVGSARTKRVKHWMKGNPHTIFIGMTGTLSDKSLRDYHHLLKWSHPLDTPLPRDWHTLEDWAHAVDANVPDYERLAPGALLEFCAPGETARAGLHRRLAETSGFILAQEQSIDIPLYMTARRDIETPSNVREAIALMDDAWVTPNGEPVPDGARAAQRMRELSLGFYYVWDWSKCTPDGKPDRVWLDARNEWASTVREICKLGREELDSELRVRNATKAGTLPKSRQASARAAWEAWHVQSGKREPDVKAVWLSDFAMRWAMQWANEEPGIVWCEHTAVQDWFDRRSGLQVFGAGLNEELRVLSRSEHAGTSSIVCSRASHFRGKNLQAWNRNLLLTPSPNGRIHEQLLGRTHRAKQKAESVQVDFLAHTDISFRSMADAVKSARYTNETLGAPQKLLSCIAQGWKR